MGTCVEGLSGVDTEGHIDDFPGIGVGSRDDAERRETRVDFDC